MPRPPRAPHRAPAAIAGWRVSLDFCGRRLVERGFRGDEAVTVGEGAGAALCLPGIAGGAREGATLAAGDWLAAVDGLDGEVTIAGERRPLAAYREAGGVRLGRGDGATLRLTAHPEVVLTLRHELPEAVGWGVRLGLRDLGQHLALGGALVGLLALLARVEAPVAVVEVKGDPEAVDTALARVLFTSLRELPAPPQVARPAIVAAPPSPVDVRPAEVFGRVIGEAIEEPPPREEGEDPDVGGVIVGRVRDPGAGEPEPLALLGAIEGGAVTDLLIAEDDERVDGRLAVLEVVTEHEGDAAVAGRVSDLDAPGDLLGDIVAVVEPGEPPAVVDVAPILDTLTGAVEVAAPPEGGRHSHAADGEPALHGSLSGTAAVQPAITCDDPDRAPKEQVDVVFVVDVSTTMGFMLDRIERGIAEVDAAVREVSREPRYGLVVFVDDVLVAGEGKPYASVADLRAELARWRAFTASNRQIHSEASNLDWPENSLDALHAAATRFAWRPADTTLRLVVHATDDDFGEAPAIQSGQAVQHTYRETVAALRAAEVRVTTFAARLGGQCECLDVKPGLLASFHGRPSLPDATGGAAFDIDEVAGGSLSFAAAVKATIGGSICRSYPLLPGGAKARKKEGQPTAPPTDEVTATVEAAP